MVCCLLLCVLALSHVLMSVESNPQVSEPQDQVQDSLQDSFAACLDGVTLDQQLMKTMLVNLQKQITQLQDHNPAARPMGGHNIVQCSQVDLNDGRGEGRLQTCAIHKNSLESTLRVVWSGNLMLYSLNAQSTVCRRWFFTINGQECQQPAPIDAMIYVRSDLNMNKPAYLEGLCRNITAGDVNVAFNVGACLGMRRNGHASTGWQTTSRIIVEELYAEDPQRIN